MADSSEPKLELASATTAAKALSRTEVAGEKASTRDSAETSEAVFPPLHNSTDANSNVLAVPAPLRPRAADEHDEDEPAVARPFQRTTSPEPGNASLRRNPTAAAGNDGDGGDGDDGDDDGEGDDSASTRKKDRAFPRGGADGGLTKAARALHKMHKFTLYETTSRFYLVGADVLDKRYRILKIDRTINTDAGDKQVSMTEDPTVYSQKDMNQLLDTIDDGNRGSGGLRLRCTTWGLLGFIKFTGPYYMLLITKKSTVAMIGGHYIYQVDGTELIPLAPRGGLKSETGRGSNAEESRFLAILNNVDLTRSFYYSYSYDITRTLQHNISREREALLRGEPFACEDEADAMFMWNHYLLRPAGQSLASPLDWCRTIVHGYMDQANVSVYGRTAYITIIARRSRYFAGARFLKRGVNDLGCVANDVETEQIVSEALTTSFHAPGPRYFASPAYTAHVQHRGSIPLHWTQDNTGVTPKPPIELHLVDPFYTAAALHFDNLFERYGAPVYVLNLIKARERTPREGKLLTEYTKAVDYLNQFLPDGRARIVYRAWDMSRAAKSRDQDVIGTLEAIAEDVVATTGFFHNGDGHTSPARAQNGVARTNCIDCLDRTNAAQFVIGKRALGRQLHALGILGHTDIDYDTDAVNLFTHMWHDHGDTIAVQYGGSQLVNTMETYRKINQWTSQSRDMLESFKRYYNNSFLDGQRQEAYNLFLGNYIFAQGKPLLWDLATDYYLHHADPRNYDGTRRRGYIHWFTPNFLQERTLAPYPSVQQARKNEALRKPVSSYDDYWLEYYRPTTLSSFINMFAFKMNRTIKYIPIKATHGGRYDLSPFRVRTTAGSADADADAEDGHDRKAAARRNAGRLLGPKSAAAADNAVSVPLAGRGISLHHWLHSSSSPQKDGSNMTVHSSQQRVGGQAPAKNAPAKKASALEKTRAAQWTFAQVVHNSFNPTVSGAEADDYARYVAHPHNLPLVVSAETPVDDVDAEYQEYVGGSWLSDGLTVPTASSGDAPASVQHHGHSGSVASNATLPWPGLMSEETAATSNRGGHLTEAVVDERLICAELLRVGENPLTVTEEDARKKRYRAYGKWLRGKSLFKQQPVDV